MTNDYVCFAAVSEDGTIVRPVLSENQRWLKGEVPEVVPGRYISCDFLPTDSASVYPHATEDRKVNADIQIGALLSNADLYRKALSMVDREVNGIFAGALQDEAYGHLEKRWVLRCSTVVNDLISFGRGSEAAAA